MNISETQVAYYKAVDYFDEQYIRYQDEEDNLLSWTWLIGQGEEVVYGMEETLEADYQLKKLKESHGNRT